MSHKSHDESVSEFTQSIGMLVRRVRAASGNHDLSMSETSVMARLSREGAATIAELARSESLRPQSMGAIVATLEAAALVERKPHPTDGRQVLIALTEKGEALRKSGKDARRQWLGQAIAQLDQQDQETLFAAGEIMQRLVEL